VPHGDHQLHVPFVGRWEGPHRFVAFNEPSPEGPIAAVVLEVPEETTDVLEIEAPSAVIEVDSPPDGSATRSCRPYRSGETLRYW